MRPDGSEAVAVELSGRIVRWAEEILQAGREHTRLLDRTLVETEMVRRRVGGCSWPCPAPEGCPH